MTPVAISYILRSPLVQQELARRRTGLEVAQKDSVVEESVRAKETLERAAVRAAETQVGLLNVNDPRVKLSASNSILDRVFGGKEVKGTSINISAESVQLLSLAIREAKSA
jgi:hypothetical protein